VGFSGEVQKKKECIISYTESYQFMLVKEIPWQGEGRKGINTPGSPGAVTLRPAEIPGRGIYRTYWVRVEWFLKHR
jgi:hypothetical protein